MGAFSTKYQPNVPVADCDSLRAALRAVARLHSTCGCLSIYIFFFEENKGVVPVEPGTSNTPPGCCS